MKCMSVHTILLLLSASSLVLAISLAGGSVLKSVNWNSLSVEREVQEEGIYLMRLHAYQTLWASHDASTGNKRKFDETYIPEKMAEDTWRDLIRHLVLATPFLGICSVFILLLASLVPVIKKKRSILFVCRLTSSAISMTAGIMLAYALNQYRTHYKTLMDYDPFFGYPDEDYLTTGFFMAAAACAFYFFTVLVNIISLLLPVKSETVVSPF